MIYRITAAFLLTLLTGCVTSGSGPSYSHSYYRADGSSTWTRCYGSYCTTTDYPKRESRQERKERQFKRDYRAKIAAFKRNNPGLFRN